MAVLSTQLVPKILIIENQMIIAADVSLQLSKLGYKVIGINTRSVDALVTIENNRPDIVLMNIDLQGKVNGLRTARAIVETFQIPIIFLSANTNKEIFNGAVETQPYAYITKPFDKNGLRRGIEMTLARMVAEGLWSS